MLCKNPFVQGRRSFGCGQCLPCRFNRRRTWAHRIMLEAAERSDNAFITLTYADESIPLLKPSITSPGRWEAITESERGSVVVGSGLLQTLVPRDLTLWLKRFRKEISPVTVRYYAVGEYGDVTQRPHYHVAMFGFPVCLRGGSALYCHGRSPCEVCAVVGRTWGNGRVSVDNLTVESSQYIAGYVTKKMTAVADERLGGRFPEFARMSTNPGIGAGFMHEVASALLEKGVEDMVDVPMALRHGNRSLPLGAYLRRKLRTLVGRDEKTPEPVLQALEEELRPLYEKAKANPTSFKASEAFKDEITLASRQRILQFETKAKIFNKRKERL